jgi:hypothetical protein
LKKDKDTVKEEHPEVFDTPFQTISTPLMTEPFGLSNKMTAHALHAIGEVGGPRCCKRDSYLSILQAVDFVKENMGIEMEKQTIVCDFSSQNNQCIGKRCPFSKNKSKQ